MEKADIISLIQDYQERFDKDSLSERTNDIMTSCPNRWEGYFIKSELFINGKNYNQSLETVNEGIGETNATELYYQKARILKEIDVKQAIETYLYLIQIDNNAYSCIQAYNLIDSSDQKVEYCNWYFEYHPVTIDIIESAFAVFALLIKEYNKKPFEGFFVAIDKMNLEHIKNDILSNTAEEVFYNIWKLAKDRNINEALIMYNQLFAEVDILKEGFNWNTPKYPFYGLNHYGYGSSESIRNEFHFQQVIPYREYDILLIIKNNEVEKVANLFIHFTKWNIDGYIKIVDKEFNDYTPYTEELEGKKEWHVYIHQASDRWYTSYENIYIAIRLFAPYLEDALFFIDESYNTWIDEYKINNGKLYFERSYAEEEYRGTKFKVLEEKASQREELKHFISMEFLENSAIDTAEDEGYFFYSLMRKTKITAQEVKRTEKAVGKALYYNPQNEQAWLHKGIVYQLSNKPKEAIQSFEKAHSINKKNIAVLLILGIEYFNQQQYDKATACFEQFNIIKPKLKISYLITGYIDLILKKELQFNKNFEKVIELSLKHPNKFIHIEEYLQKAKDYHLILIAYLDYVDNNLKDISDKDIHTIQNMLSLNCTEWMKWLWDRKDKKKQKIALQFFDKAVQYNPQNVQLYINKAKLLDNKHAQEAKQLLEKALSINPKKQEVVSLLYDICMKNKDYETAIQYALTYLDIIGNNFKGYGNEPHILYGKLANAYYAYAGELLYKQHQYKKAEELYDKVLGLYPKLSNEWKKFEGPWVGRSDAQSYQKNYIQAFAYAEDALTINKNSAYAWSAKGNCLNNLGKYEEALDCCDEAIKWKPDYFYPWYVKACIYALTNRSTKAIEMIKKTLELEPNRKDQLKKDPDFKSLSNNKDFKELIK